MNSDKIKEGFNNVASQYDKQREKFIPCYDDYYGTSIDFLAGIIDEPESILDLGAGTGLLTQHVFSHFPNSKYTLMDISSEMLRIAKQRFSGKAGFDYIREDYSEKLPDGEFDLICSALSIHHLKDEDKQNLYNRVFEQLTDGGCFINLDQFNPLSDYLNSHYNKFWYKQIKESDLPEEEYKKWIERRKLDRENTLDETRRMLVRSGFNTVECIYSYMKFGVVLGIKRQ